RPADPPLPQLDPRGELAPRARPLARLLRRGARRADHGDLVPGPRGVRPGRDRRPRYRAAVAGVRRAAVAGELAGGKLRGGRVAPSATVDEVKQAYKLLVKQNHPDRVASMAPVFQELAEAETKKLNIAYAEAQSYFRQDDPAIAPCQG